MKAAAHDSPQNSDSLNEDGATLYVVATPIGNLSDISARAIETLSRAGNIAAEDTRVTQRLMEHCGIRARLVAVHCEAEFTSSLDEMVEHRFDDGSAHPRVLRHRVNERLSLGAQQGVGARGCRVVEGEIPGRVGRSDHRACWIASSTSGERDAR